MTACTPCLHARAHAHGTQSVPWDSPRRPSGSRSDGRACRGRSEAEPSARGTHHPARKRLRFAPPLARPTCTPGRMPTGRSLSRGTAPDDRAGSVRPTPPEPLRELPGRTNVPGFPGGGELPAPDRFWGGLVGGQTRLPWGFRQGVFPMRGLSRGPGPVRLPSPSHGTNSVPWAFLSARPDTPGPPRLASPTPLPRSSIAHPALTRLRSASTRQVCLQPRSNPGPAWRPQYPAPRGRPRKHREKGGESY